MFRNYLKTSIRNLWKNRGYSFLNIAGLAIGIACAALIFLWVEDELTFNHYFSNRDNLFNYNITRKNCIHLISKI